MVFNIGNLKQLLNKYTVFFESFGCTDCCRKKLMNIDLYYIYNSILAVRLICLIQPLKVFEIGCKKIKKILSNKQSLAPASGDAI